ncbi:Wadjet anti-phage system protein JetD domain-containing protein [Spirillospora sp. CA-142024]|uniref:Wadjet anti-phage system protein JetD domain-containing protein n=1 Tax=Spirillospora sp. CA-142024 TaxID=3240036 RepID=UPI003D8FE45C
MHEPDQVMNQIRVRYRKNWRAWLLDGADTRFSFPLGPPSAQDIARQGDTVGQWLRTWRDWAHRHPTARLRSITRRTVAGPQDVFTHLDLPTIDDLVLLDQGLARHWQQAINRWRRIRALPGGVVKDRLRPWLPQISDMDGPDFELLLEAARWFTDNPHSGLTIRQVPILGMHTKWLARNRRLVLACLNITEQLRSDETGEKLEQDDLDPLGLKALPVHIDVILTDPADRARVGGIRHLNAPLPEIDALPIHPDTILIIENKESAYLVPDRPRTVVVHSLGNHLNVLGGISWLNSAHYVYWGDLDRAGFTLLSRARTHLPSLISTLMDPGTLDAHRTLAVQDETRADKPEPNLSDTEVDALSALTPTPGTYLRLEQERLPAPFVLEQLQRSMNEATP